MLRLCNKSTTFAGAETQTTSSRSVWSAIVSVLLMKLSHCLDVNSTPRFWESLSVWAGGHRSGTNNPFQPNLTGHYTSMERACCSPFETTVKSEYKTGSILQTGAPQRLLSKLNTNQIQGGNFYTIPKNMVCGTAQ